MIQIINECLDELESVPDKSKFLEELVCTRFNKCIESEMTDLEDKLSQVERSIDYSNIKSVSKLITKYSKLVSKTYGKFCSTLIYLSKYFN